MKQQSIVRFNRAVRQGHTLIVVAGILLAISATWSSFDRMSVTSAALQEAQGEKLSPGFTEELRRREQEASLLGRDEASVLHFRQMASRVDESGRLPVIVRLKASYRPEGEIKNELEVKSQRVVIARLRDELLGDELVGYDPSSVKSFEYLPYLAVTVNTAGIESLRASSKVLDVQEDKLERPTLTQSVPLIGATNAWASGYTGAGQTVAIIDTGVDKSHPFLTGKVVSEACYSTNLSSQLASSVCPAGVAESTGADSGVPCGTSDMGCDHGTHVAGIAAGKGSSFSGVAKDANLIAIQVFTRFDSSSSCGGSAKCVLAYDSDIIKGLERVYALRSSFSIAAVNLSLGGGRYSSYCDSSEVATKAAIDLLRSAGIATVIASGNEAYTNSLATPACISTAISVGSVTDTNPQVSSFSNSATFLNLLAPGEGITSSVPGGNYATWSGTSMATPHVTGAWAIAKQKSPGATVSQILDAFTATGTNLTDSRNGIAKPLIKVDAAIAAIGKVEPPPPSPTAPTSLSASVVSSTQVNLSWVDSSTTETGFRIWRKTGSNGSWSIIASVTQNSTSYQNSGLSSGVTYYYYLTAYNTGGDSPASNEVNATTTATLPSTPGNLKLTVPSSTQINLTWVDASSNETGFRIRRKTGENGTWAQIAAVGRNVISYQNSGLTSGVTYYYNVVSYNQAGESAASNEASATTLSPPPAPTALQAVAASTTQINLTWTDSSSTETGFNIRRKTGSSGSWTLVGTVGQNITSYQNTGLSIGVTYFYTVSALNSVGESSPSNEASATTPASSLVLPGAPTALQVSALSTTQATLGWVDNSDNESGFKVRQRTSSALPWTVVATLGPGITSYQASGLTSGLTYYYSILAFNAAGESTATPQASVTIPLIGFATVTNGSSTSDSVAKAESKYYKIYVPSAASQLVVQTSGSGDLDLYLKYGSEPARYSYSCRSISNTANERCLVSFPGGGDWYILAYGVGTGANTFVMTVSYQGGATLIVKSLVNAETPAERQDGMESEKDGLGMAPTQVAPEVVPDELSDRRRESKYYE